MGGNLPFGELQPTDTLMAAVKMLAELGFSGIRRSRLYRTPCFPAGAGPDYVNAALSASCPPDWSAERVLENLHKIESDLGRVRVQRWGGRTLDLDLIAMGDVVRPDLATQTAWRDLPPTEQGLRAPDRLILPHPRLQDRAFVLVPLADVAPDWVHPILQKSVQEMLKGLSAVEIAEVQPLAG